MAELDKAAKNFVELSLPDEASYENQKSNEELQQRYIYTVRRCVLCMYVCM